MPTSLVVLTNVSGTSFTIDVSVLELSADLGTKDFSVTHNGSDLTTAYTKTSATQVSYAGASVTLGTKVVVRRLSSFTPAESSFISTTTAFELTNSLTKARQRIEELDARVEYLLAQVALGGITIGTIPISDSVYGAGWNGVATIAPSQNAVYDRMVLLATLASPALTGTPTAPTAALYNNSTTLATTAFVNSSRSPVVVANRNTDQGLPNSADTIVIWNNATVNNSSVLNTSTGVITAPVTGNYLITCSLEMTSTTVSGGIVIFSTASVFVNGSRRCYLSRNTVTGASTLNVAEGGCAILRLNANDTFDIRVLVTNTGTAPTNTILANLGQLGVMLVSQ